MGKERIGIIGGGTMGSLMAQKLIEHGYEVILADKNPDSLERNRAAGAQVTSDNLEVVKQAKKILVSLPHPQISKAVAAEAASAMCPGTIWIEASTIMPGDAQEIGAIVEKAGGRILECPILGKPVAVGNWVMVAGGEKETWAEAEQMLLSFCLRVVYAGQVGNGNSIKLLNNTLYSIINVGIAEVMAIADNAGVDKAIFHDIVSNSHAATNCGLFREVGKRIADGEFDHPAMTNAIVEKDNGLGVRFAKSVGISPMLAGLTLNLYENANFNGFGHYDNAIMYQYLKQIYQNR